MREGKLNATVECNPLLGPQLVQALVRGVGLTSLAGGFASEFAQLVELLGVGVLGLVVRARDGPEDLRGRLMGLVDGDAQLLREFEIDAHVSCS